MVVVTVQKFLSPKSYITYPPCTCSTSSLLFLLSLYEAKEVRALQGFHHSIAVSVGSRMSGGHAVQKCCIHLFAQSLVATHAEEGHEDSLPERYWLWVSLSRYHSRRLWLHQCNHWNIPVGRSLRGIQKYGSTDGSFGCGRDRRRGRSLQANYAPTKYPALTE